jgi:hypothetical protein
LIKGEADEQSSNSTESHFGEDVTGHPPVLLECAVCALPYLGDQRRCELRATRLFADVEILIAFLFMDLVNLALDLLKLLAFFPHIMPVLAAVVGSVVDNLQHVLGWVLIFATLASAMALEILQQCARIVANFAKVHRPTAPSQE